MVCTTITVLEIAPTIGILDKGLTVDGQNPLQCATTPGKAIGFYIKATLVFTRNITARVAIAFDSPAGVRFAKYSSINFSVGTYEYFLGYTAETYQPGTYSITSVSVTPV